MAWKNGLFVFNNMDLRTILREVSRWYDVEITYKTTPGKELYGGGISRNLNLSEVLHVLEENGTNHFKIDGNKVEVLP
jgi:ferric-dicitrate binding protein FerR (iron transport regulator)